MAQLTDRQKEIKDLIEKGKKADEIGKTLGITTNAVYQQIRRMRGRSGGRSAAKPKASASKSGRKSGAKPAAAAKPAATPAPTPAPAAKTEPRPMTPLQAVRARRDEVSAGLREAEAAVTAAQRTLKQAEESRDKVKAKVDPELAVLDAAEAALKGEAPKAAAKPKATTAAKPSSGAKPAAKSGTKASGSKGGSGSAKGTSAAKPTSNGKGNAASVPEPTTQAEREATADAVEADAAHDAAEAPQTPVAA
jgi:DNA-binding CsgD family transcriptional regulator